MVETLPVGAARRGLPNPPSGQTRESGPPLEGLFLTPHPLEIEIGCGKGKFLLARAESEPRRNFLGVDRISKWMKIGRTRGEKRRLENLRFIKAEIREFLQSVPPESVAAFHIYFPDPWPKRRHRKRRLVTAEFLRNLYGRLKPGGFVHLASDDADYFRQIKQAAAQSAEWAQREGMNERLVSPGVITNYELKYQSAGKILHYLELRKSVRNVSLPDPWGRGG